MQNLPPFVYSKAFWTALSYVVAGVLSLLVVFGVLPPQYALSAGAVLAIFLAVLNWLHIEPELRARAAMMELQRFLAEKRALVPSKKSK